MTNIINLDNYKEKNVHHYVDELGVKPFEVWIRKRSDEAEVKIETYIKRVASGGSKENISPLKEGVYEIKIDYGPGFRVYFGIDKQRIVVLCAGDKASQNSDIERAVKYWRRYEKIGRL